MAGFSSHIGEFDFIARVKEAFAQVGSCARVGIGDDCAVLPQDARYETLVSTDMLVEGTHFLLDDITPYQLGWKAAASNFSDIAAMGGEPVGSFLALGIPENLSQRLEQGGAAAAAKSSLKYASEYSLKYASDGTANQAESDAAAVWLDEFIRGYRDISVLYGFPLLGGDTTVSKGGMSICVTVLGRCPVADAVQGDGLADSTGGTLRSPANSTGARLRSMACPGDLICVTGTLGDSSAGLDLILNGGSVAGSEEADARNLNAKDFDAMVLDVQVLDVQNFERNTCSEEGDAESNSELTQNRAYLIGRHYMPSPRVREGMLLREIPGVHAMMDISDGIASDLLHILKASGVSAEIDCAALPLSTQLLSLYSSDSKKDGEPCANLHYVLNQAGLPTKSVHEFALCGGEDYELLFTVSAEALEQVMERFKSDPSLAPITVIGRVAFEGEFSAAGTIRYRHLPVGLEADKLHGFDHFKC